MRRSVVMLCLLLSGPVLAQVKGELGGVYVAGDAFSLEQVAADALRERASSPVDPLAVLVLRSELRRLTRSGSTQESQTLVDRLQSARVAVFVCDRDARSAGLEAGAFLPGVRVERGWTREEAAADVGSRKADKSRTPELQLRRIRRLCAEP